MSPLLHAGAAIPEVTNSSHRHRKVGSYFSNGRILNLTSYRRGEVKYEIVPAITEPRTFATRETL